jgi:hypothetical protein
MPSGKIDDLIIYFVVPKSAEGSRAEDQAISPKREKGEKFNNSPFFFSPDILEGRMQE